MCSADVAAGILFLSGNNRSDKSFIHMLKNKSIQFTFPTSLSASILFISQGAVLGCISEKHNSPIGAALMA